MDRAMKVSSGSEKELVWREQELGRQAGEDFVERWWS